MRAIVISFVLTFAAAAACAQQPAPATKTYASAADVAALLAKAKADHKTGQPRWWKGFCISPRITRISNIEPQSVRPPFTSMKPSCFTYWMAPPLSPLGQIERGKTN